MIRDRLVVGIRNNGLLEKLQMDSESTVEKAVTKIKQHEQIKKQQSIVRDRSTTKQKETNVDFLKFKNKSHKYQTGKSTYGTTYSDTLKGQKSCRCGKAPPHSLNNCAACEAENAKKGDVFQLCVDLVEWGQSLKRKVTTHFSWGQYPQVPNSKHGKEQQK